MPPEAQFPDWADLWLPKGPLIGDELTNPVFLTTESSSPSTDWPSGSWARSPYAPL